MWNKKIDKIIIVVIIVTILYFSIHVLFALAKEKPTEKEFVRYYLSHEQATINIMIQWKNHPDTIAYSTFNPQQAIWVLNELQETDANKIQEVK